MDIIFYKNSSDKDKLNKSLTEVITLSGTLRDECDILRPVIRIEHEGMINANYCYIPVLARYYFVSQTIERNDLIRITCEVDPFMSFKAEINNLDVIIETSTNKNNEHLASDIFTATVKTATDVLAFPSGFNESGEFILITAGG